MIICYENQLTPEINERRKIIITRTENDGFNRSNYQRSKQNRETQQGDIPKPIMGYNEDVTNRNGSVRFPDDHALKLNDSAEVYPKLAACDTITRKYKLPVN